MRNYWLKILLGSVGIFAIGMIGVSIVRGGISKVHSVVAGDGPITIPLGLIPFVLSGERLGNLDHVTLHRDSPSRVTEVELEVNLGDSLLAQGLAGCRLAANIEGNNAGPDVNIRVGRGKNDKNTFRCLAGDSIPADLIEYGTATLQPGDVEIPLLLPLDVVNELQSLDFADDSAAMAAGDSDPQIEIPDADSIAAEVERTLDSLGIQRAGRDSVVGSPRRFADSIRAEARRRMAEAADPQ
jgi:hypothetical protein